MKTWILLFLTLSILPAFAEGSYRGKRDYRPDPGSPWLGIHLTWMEKATAAQLNEVPGGFGLLLDEIEPQSPAQDAGLRSLDVLWKYDDQLVASKRQLFALINRTGVGNEAILTVSRAGENLIMPIVIGTRPLNPEKLAQGATEVLMPPLPISTIIQTDWGKRSGFIKEGEVTVSLSRKAEGFHFSISKGEEVLEEGMLRGEEASSWPATIDDKARRKLQVLFKSLLNAENREASSPRLPRVRRVPVLPKTDEK